MINKDIVHFGCGEDHLVFVNHREEAFGIGKNQFGQLGTRQSLSHMDIITPVFEKYKIKSIYCTQFATFFTSNTSSKNNQLYACGLNNRGQLGIGSSKEKIAIPQRVESLS